MRRSRGYTRRYSRRIKSVKYSNETANMTGTWELHDNGTRLVISCIAAADLQGTRKCKNFEISMCGSEYYHDTEGVTPDQSVPIAWALVYVPEGTTPSPMSSVPLLRPRV